MKQMTLLFALLLVFFLAIPASAVEITAPEAPESAKDHMPQETDSFGEALWQLLGSVLKTLRPDLKAACGVSLSVITAVLIVSLLRTFSGSVKSVSELGGCVVIAGLLFRNADTMIAQGTQTIRQLSDYGKLLWPVMTAAMAAQGGVTTSAALYTATAGFDAILSSLISRVLAPMIYPFLALSLGNSAVGEDILGKMRDLLKNSISWCLKTLLTVFTTYMSITGVVSGTTDAVALKAARVAISSMVPVVGGILSDASESVLVSTELAKNTAGVYGILAVLAAFLEPFFRIGIQYLVLKATAAVCGLFGTKRITDLIGDFSCAMGLLLAMTGSVCLMLLISTVCFMKGVG